MRYANKRQAFRGPGGRFRKARLSDIGLAGVCPTCSHFTVRHYDGDPLDPFPNPAKFRDRCFHCEPETAAEAARKAEIEASRPKPPSLLDLLKVKD